MAKTMHSGPVIAGRGTTNDDPDFGPSVLQNGALLMDPRFPYTDNVTTVNTVGWRGINYIPCLDAVPATASATVLAAAQAGIVSTKLTLNTTSAGGALVQIASPVTVLPMRTVVPAGAVAIDSLPGTLSWGQTGCVNEYDPTKALARTLTVTWAGNDTAASLNVTGWDTYGQPMTEHIAGGSGTTTNGNKAFKFLGTATPAGTVSGSNISLGTRDVFGFPLRVDSFAYVNYFWNSAEGTATGITYASTSTPTSATGDVRGTVSPGTSNGVIALQVFVTPRPAALVANGATVMSVGLVGQVQA